MRKTFQFILAILLAASCSSKESNPILTVEGGKLQGVLTDIPSVYVYRGIPYAAAPVGDLRWKAPQPVENWDGVKIADSFGNACYQEAHSSRDFYTKEFFFDGDAPFSEDCLYLNVWTSAPAQADKKLPVAMWIHGGAYVAGWGFEPEMDGKEWAAKDVVLVTINYRLGLFGFLAHPLLSAENPEGVSGNYGMLDQIAALRWIKNNISQFGGDPDNVTIMGQSAGAASVRSLAASPLARGLFNKAIIQSGGGVGTNIMRHRPLQEIEKENEQILSSLGYTSLEELRALSTEELFGLNEQYRKNAGSPWASIYTQPCTDGYVNTAHFDEAAMAGEIADVPYLTGGTADDIPDLAKGIGDFCLFREKHGNKAYAYKFCRALPGDNSGAFHSSELWYTFKSLKNSWRPFSEADYALSERMLSAWTNFVKYADPNGPEGGAWTPYTDSCRETMIFTLDDSGNLDNSHMENLHDAAIL